MAGSPSKSDGCSSKSSDTCDNELQKSSSGETPMSSTVTQPKKCPKRSIEDGMDKYVLHLNVKTHHCFTNYKFFAA